MGCSSLSISCLASVMLQQIKVSQPVTNKCLGWRITSRPWSLLTAGRCLFLAVSFFLDAAVISTSYSRYPRMAELSLTFIESWNRINMTWHRLSGGLCSGRHCTLMWGTTAPLALAVMLREVFKPLSTQSNKWDNSPTDYQLFYLQCPGLF